MPAAHEFEYMKPATLNDALSFLAQHKDNACVLAGGTDLTLRIKEGLETPDSVLDIKGIKSLQRLEIENNHLFVGALVTFTHLIESPLVSEKFPLLRDAASTVGSVGIRNRATLAGNICSAVPSLDSGPALLVHEAVIHIQSLEGSRTIPVAQWFAGPKQSALRPGELVTGICLPLPEKPYAGCYVKLGRYAGEDLAQAGVGILALEEQEYRIAFCAVGPTPIRSKRIEALLNGKEMTDALIAEAQDLLLEEISPITDIRSSKEYRRLMTRVMFDRGIRSAISRLAGERPEDGAIWI